MEHATGHERDWLLVLEKWLSRRKSPFRFAPDDGVGGQPRFVAGEGTRRAIRPLKTCNFPCGRISRKACENRPWVGGRKNKKEEKKIKSSGLRPEPHQGARSPGPHCRRHKQPGTGIQNKTRRVPAQHGIRGKVPPPGVATASFHARDPGPGPEAGHTAGNATTADAQRPGRDGVGPPPPPPASPASPRG